MSLGLRVDPDTFVPFGTSFGAEVYCVGTLYIQTLGHHSVVIPRVATMKVPHNKSSSSGWQNVDKPMKAGCLFLPNKNQGSKIRPKVVDVFWQHHNNSGRVCDHFTQTIWYQVPTLTTNMFHWFCLHLKKCCVHILLHIFSVIRLCWFSCNNSKW